MAVNPTMAVKQKFMQTKIKKFFKLKKKLRKQMLKMPLNTTVSGNTINIKRKQGIGQLYKYRKLEIKNS